MKYTLLHALGISVIFTLISCADNSHRTLNFDVEPNLPEVSYDYVSENEKIASLSTPDFNLVNSISADFTNSNVFTTSNSTIKSKVENNEAATLGRVLFYDSNLSKNNSIACASCHQQKKAFADGLDLSQGFAGKVTTRNSMAFSNLATNNNFFWDSREDFIHELVIAPVTNHIEMGMEDMSSLIEKLKSISYYPELFEKAYGSTLVDEARFSNAITQFLSSISSTSSTYDRALENDFEEFNQLQKLGMAIFFSEKAQCSSCHAGVNFAAADGQSGEYSSSLGTANIGLDVEYADDGLNKGQFKIPSLRNIALTAPYMHDGRFSSLREVLNHYNSNIQAHPNLDKKLVKNGNPLKISLSSLELDALEAFLNTLTDEEMINNPMFANPFK